jgi:hypothetical protein
MLGGLPCAGARASHLCAAAVCFTAAKHQCSPGAAASSSGHASAGLCQQRQQSQPHSSSTHLDASCLLTPRLPCPTTPTPQEYQEILEDMREECGKHGPVTKVVIPRPTPEEPTPVGAGKVVVEFGDINASVKARNALHGRKFAGRTVIATYLSEEAFAAGLYDQEA